MESLPSRMLPAESFNPTLKQSRLPALAYALLCLGAAAMALRFLTIPWDFGGFFFQVWMTLVGTAAATELLGRLKRLPRILVGCIAFPLVTFLMFGTIYFAPQLLFPFMFFGGAGCVAIWFWSQAKWIPAGLVALLLLPLALYCGYGAKHISQLIRFENLKGSDLKEIRFTPLTDTHETTTVREPATLARIADSLRFTSPYSPNHEGIRNPVEMVLLLTDGSTISLSLGKGNRAHPETAWIGFGIEAYQNPQLSRVLATDVGLREFVPR